MFFARVETSVHVEVADGDQGAELEDGLGGPMNDSGVIRKCPRPESFTGAGKRFNVIYCRPVAGAGARRNPGLLWTGPGYRVLDTG